MISIAMSLSVGFFGNFDVARGKNRLVVPAEGWFPMGKRLQKSPGLEKLHYDKQICRSLAVDHGVWCLKVLGEGSKSLRNNLGRY